MSKYAGFFAAYNASVKKGNRMSKEDTVSTFTGGRTESLKELSPDELEALVSQLNGLSGFKPVRMAGDEKRDNMRKSIIAIFKKMGRTTVDAIGWAEKQGVKGQKKPFNDYSTDELFVLIRVSEKILSDYQFALRKQISNI